MSHFWKHGKWEDCNLDSNWTPSVVSKHGKDNSQRAGHQSQEMCRHCPFTATKHGVYPQHPPQLALPYHQMTHQRVIHGFLCFQPFHTIYKLREWNPARSLKMKYFGGLSHLIHPHFLPMVRKAIESYTFPLMLCVLVATGRSNTSKETWPRAPLLKM